MLIKELENIKTYIKNQKEFLKECNEEKLKNELEYVLEK